MSSSSLGWTVPRTVENDGYRALVWLLAASSSVVLVEPAPYDIAIIVIAAAVILSGKVHLPKQATGAAVFLLLFNFAALLPIVLARDPVRALRFGSITTYLSLSWFVLLHLSMKRRWQTAETLLSGYRFAAVVFSAIGLLAWMHILPNSGPLMYGGFRVKGLFKDPNVWGPFLVPALLYAIHEWQGAHGLKKLGRFAGIGLITLGILLSFSRGGMDQC